jgi:ribosomal protein L37AE/L43A
MAEKSEVPLKKICPACGQKLVDSLNAGAYVLHCPKCGYSGTFELTAEAGQVFRPTNTTPVLGV